VAERSRKYRAASAFREAGVVFRSQAKEHHPVGVNKEAPRHLFKEAPRHLFDDAATPPRGDARRGMRRFKMTPPNPHLASRLF